MYRLMILVVFYACVFGDETGYREVEINSGLVIGHKAKDGDYLAFLGIPYAKPPVDDRFKAPLPPQYWQKPFHANRQVKCPQFGTGDEDCLILNVFTPTKILNGPLPVLVYIHGGSFLMGAGQTKGFEAIIKQNVIVVTINYRLGALGFLCLGIPGAPGNAGLKDQVEALKWVNRNIAYFRGDPSRVTLYGMSAGAASVELLVLSKLSRGLFQNVIIESGTANSVWAIDGKPIETALRVAEALKFPKHKKSLLDAYGMVSTDNLTLVNKEYYQNLTDGTFGFVPCIEKKLQGIDPFITESPRTIYKRNKYDKVPMMFIFSSLEGLFLRSTDYYELDYKSKMNKNFADFIPGNLVFDTEEIKNHVVENLRNTYFANDTIGDTTIIQYMNYFGDYMVMNGLLNSAISNSRDNNPVYLLEFAHKGKLGSYEKFFDNLNFAGHGDAIKHVILNKVIEDVRDRVAVDRMVKIVTNFMKYSNPIPTRTELLSIHWPPVTPNNVTYLKLSEDLQVFEEPVWNRKLIWDLLYNNYRKEVYSVDSTSMKQMR